MTKKTSSFNIIVSTHLCKKALFIAMLLFYLG